MGQGGGEGTCSKAEFSEAVCTLAAGTEHQHAASIAKTRVTTEVNHTERIHSSDDTGSEEMYLT